MIGKGLVCASILFSSSVLSLVIHLSMLKVENYFHINFIAKELRGIFFVKSYLFFSLVSLVQFLGENIVLKFKFVPLSHFHGASGKTKKNISRAPFVITDAVFH